MIKTILDDDMSGLRSLQVALDGGKPISFIEIDHDFKMIYDEDNGSKRFWYPKIVNGKIQALATFGLEGTFNGIDRYSVNYAVSEKNRGRGLAIEAVSVGIEDLKKRLKHFYLEALIDETNIYSIKVAEKLFSASGVITSDSTSGKSSLLFYRLIE